MSSTRHPKSAYVAGRTHDVDRVRLTQALLRQRGYEITFDWTGEEGEIRKDWGGIAHDRGAMLSQREIRAVQSADVTVLLWRDASDGQPGMVGALIEAGVALGAGRELWIVAPSRDSVFFHHPNATIFTSDDELRGALEQAA